jgi:hypothetical protein
MSTENDCEKEETKALSQDADLIREIDKLNRVLPTLVSEARSENS